MEGFQNPVGGASHRAMLDRQEMIAVMQRMQLTLERIEARLAGITAMMTVGEEPPCE